MLECLHSKLADDREREKLTGRVSHRLMYEDMVSDSVTVQHMDYFGYL